MQHIPDVLVHVTHKDRVASILRDGLLPDQERSTTHGDVTGRVYLALDRDVLTDDTHNAAFFNGPDAVVLHVNVSAYKHLLVPDPEWRSYDHHEPCHREDDLCWYIEWAIPPELISVAK